MSRFILKSLSALLFFIGLALPIMAQNEAGCEEANQFLNNYQYEQAETALKGCLESNPENIQLLRNLAHVSYQLGKYSVAKNVNSQIIALDSKNRKARMELAKLHEHENQLGLALEQYRF